MSCWVCDKANGTCEHKDGNVLTPELALEIERAESASLREQLATAEAELAKPENWPLSALNENNAQHAELVELRAKLRAALAERDAKTYMDEIARLRVKTAILRERLDELRTELESHANQEESWKTLVSGLRERLATAEALRAEFCQDFEDLLLVATKDEDAEGFVSAYHFKTGALHRLLGKVRTKFGARS